MDASKVETEVLRDLIVKGVEFEISVKCLNQWFANEYGIVFGQNSRNEQWYLMKSGLKAKRSFDTLHELLTTLMVGVRDGHWGGLWD